MGSSPKLLNFFIGEVRIFLKLESRQDLPDDAFHLGIGQVDDPLKTHPLHVVPRGEAAGDKIWKVR